MSGNPHSGHPNFIEALFCAAEVKALETSKSPQALLDKELRDQETSDGSLRAIAADELVRVKARQSILPLNFSSSIDWIILLELYIKQDGAKEAISLATGADRWGVSKITAARYIAGLIENNLVQRASRSDGSDEIVLDLTSQGRNTLTKVLSLFAENSE